MSEQWRILVVADEEDLSRSISNALRYDGYAVQGIASTAEAIRRLWTEVYHMVVADLRLASAEDFALVEWVRFYRAQTHMLLLAAPGSPTQAAQALERGVAGVLEKPVNPHLLREEVRRLLLQSGFSASLDSFDLLDVIQAVTLSRKNIALLVNTGQETRGMLRFQNGELVWAEYGALRGEEAFFALAAYKNGTVQHQAWSGQITPNVTQPLSRLILRALQYRTKYAEAGPPSAEFPVIAPTPTTSALDEPIDDTPFMFYGDPLPRSEAAALSGAINQESSGSSGASKDWWMETGYVPSVGAAPEKGGAGAESREPSGPLPVADLPAFDDVFPAPAASQKPPVVERHDLPSWLTEQPTQANLRPAASAAPPASVQKPSPAEWQPPAAYRPEQPLQKPLSSDTGTLRRLPAEWQESGRQPRSGPLQSIISASKSGSLPAPPPQMAAGPSVIEVSPSERLSGVQAPVEQSPQPTLEPASPVQPASPASSPEEPEEAPLSSKRNIAAIVAALQTLGYAIPGFIATAVMSADGQPIAQVSVDDLDLSLMGAQFGRALQGARLALELGAWGEHEDTVITSSGYRILLRLVHGGRGAFHVLVTTREADSAESLEVMANVEAAIAAAL